MMEATIRDPIKADPAVNDLTALHTMHIGPRAVLVVAQVKFRGELTVAEIEAAVGRLARSIMPLAGAQTSRRMIVIEPTPARHDVAAAASRATVGSRFAGRRSRYGAGEARGFPFSTTYTAVSLTGLSIAPSL
jgi:hypothetical protein